MFFDSVILHDERSEVVIVIITTVIVIGIILFGRSHHIHLYQTVTHRRFHFCRSVSKQIYFRRCLLHHYF